MAVPPRAADQAGAAAREVEMARNTIETNIIGGLERLGGFGGVADRLNSYNHYLGNPDYLQTDIQRYRAVTPAGVQTFARDQLAPASRVVLYAIPGQPAATAAVPTPPAPTAAQNQGGEAINGDEPWRLQIVLSLREQLAELRRPHRQSIAQEVQ